MGFFRFDHNEVANTHVLALTERNQDDHKRMLYFTFRTIGANSSPGTFASWPHPERSAPVCRFERPCTS